MIQIKLNGVYVTQCGCVMKTYSARDFGSHLICIGVCHGLTHSSRVTSGLGNTWFYEEAGLFGGEEGDSDFPLHLVREITP